MGGLIVLNMQGRMNGFGIGGAKKNLRKFFFYITLTYKKDTNLFINISVISKIYQSILSLFIYTYLDVTFSKLNFFGWQNNICYL